MDYILTEKSAKDFIQFANKDKIDIIAFNKYVEDAWSTEDGTQTQNLLDKVNSYGVGGTTALYDACIKALEILRKEDAEKYNLSVVLMTDGEANVGTYSSLKYEYNSVNMQIPIYSIMFGDASEKQLKEIATLTNAKIFNGKTDLVKAFKEVRGYN